MDDGLPPGLSARALTIDDIDATIAMINTCELHDSGEWMWERSDLLADVRTEGFDPQRDWIGVFRSDEIVAWGLYTHPRRAWVDVHPDHRGRGVGRWLRHWTESRGRARESDRVTQVIEDTRLDVASMLETAGYAPTYTSWVLRMDHAAQPPGPTTPNGITLRPIRPDEEAATMGKFEAAFSEFADRLPSNEAVWRAGTSSVRVSRPMI